MKLFSLIVLINTVLITAPQEPHANLSVTVEDIDQPGSGQLIIMLFDQEEGFPRSHDLAVYKGTVQQVGKTAHYTFKDVPTGTYAVAVFLDQNRNGKIDSNLIGFPKEPIGASNFAKLGKPSFKKCSFSLPETGMSIRIKLLND